jgi:uncharacterized zinc-type alcohol dehydrogenase-like protein
VLTKSGRAHTGHIRKLFDTDALSVIRVHPLQRRIHRRQLAGSGIGGIPETQEMLDFCAKHGIVSDVEMIDIQHINEAYDRLLRGDVKYRFVIDMASIKR